MSNNESCGQGNQGGCGSCSSGDCGAGGDCSAGGGAGSAGAAALDAFLEREALQKRLGHIKHKVVVLSGKGGVGKSTVAVNLAASLSFAGKRVGLLDVDIHGPSVPKMFGLTKQPVQADGDAIVPIEIGDLKIMSIGFLLPDDDAAVIWRGPMKMGVIQQFLKDVAWGELDYLIIDSPPGTGDEPLSVCQLIDDADGAVIVTTPQEVALADVRKSINFCHQLKLPVLGVVENMSGFVCPHCGEITEIFKSGGGETMADDMGVPFLGRIPIEAGIGAACDTGRPYIVEHGGTPAAEAFGAVIEALAARVESPEPEAEAGAASPEPAADAFRIAIPLAQGRLSMHFGHCEEFALIDVDTEAKTILKSERLTSPGHEPGVLPRLLAENGARLIIAGGMGNRAQSLFTERGIEVLTGAPADTPEAVVEAYLQGALECGENVCDH